MGSTEAVNAWEAIFRAQVSVVRFLNEQFSDELSFNEYDVLFNLSRLGQQSSRLRDLNELVLLTQPSISRLVDRLVARGLLEKRPDPSDGRGTIVRMTEQGSAVFRSVAREHVKWIAARVGGALTDDELEQLRVLSDKLRRGGQSTLSVAELPPPTSVSN